MARSRFANELLAIKDLSKKTSTPRRMCSIEAAGFEVLGGS